jgi:hypothetical protein
MSSRIPIVDAPVVQKYRYTGFLGHGIVERVATYSRDPQVNQSHVGFNPVADLPVGWGA